MRSFTMFLLSSVVAGEVFAASPFVAKVVRTDAAGEGIGFVLTVSVPEGNHLYESSFRVEALPGAKILFTDKPVATRAKDPQTGETVGVFAEDIRMAGRLLPGADRNGISVAYQGCDEMQCFMPETHTFIWNVVAKNFSEVTEDSGPTVETVRDWLQGRRLVTAGGYLKAADFLTFLDKAEGKEQVQSAGLRGFLSDPLTFFRRYGMWLTLLLVLAGGVLLNLTPCVLPMIPINLAIIGAGSMAGGRKRGFLLGGAYGAGMAVAYGGLGWAVLKSGLFMGSIQSSPWFNGAIALLFVFLALSLFGVFSIELNRFAKPGKKGLRKGALAAFVAGAFSAILAGACVAPVVLAVLLLAGALVAEGHASAQLLPFVLGVGMALPWPFAGAGLSVLPKPGAWMERVKQVFAIVLILLGAYYGWVAVKGFGFGGKTAEVKTDSIRAGDYEAWLAKLVEADKVGKPVFVDCWATWCKNCAAMDATTFRDTRVKARLGGYFVIRVQAEKPDEPEAREMLDQLGVKGLPGYGVLLK